MCLYFVWPCHTDIIPIGTHQENDEPQLTADSLPNTYVTVVPSAPPAESTKSERVCMDKDYSNPEEASPKQNIGTKIPVEDFPAHVKARLEKHSAFKEEYEVNSLQVSYFLVSTCVFRLYLYAVCIHALIYFASSLSKHKYTERYKGIRVLLKTR